MIIWSRQYALPRAQTHTIISQIHTFSFAIRGSVVIVNECLDTVKSYRHTVFMRVHDRQPWRKQWARTTNVYTETNWNEFVSLIASENSLVKRKFAFNPKNTYVRPAVLIGALKLKILTFVFFSFGSASCIAESHTGMGWYENNTIYWQNCFIWFNEIWAVKLNRTALKRIQIHFTLYAGAHSYIESPRWREGSHSHLLYQQ